MNELKINPKFRDIIPPLDSEEYENLRESIASEGCRDAIIVWNGTIVDGHNRLQICKEFDIPFNISEKEFDDEDTAIEWILRNQLSRRNLSDVERIRVVSKLKDCLAARGRENQVLSGELYGMGGKVLTDLSKPLSPINTRKKLAKMAGVSEGTYAKAEKVDSEAPTPIRAAMGKTISIDRAAQLNSVLKQTPEQEREAEAKRLLTAEFKEREDRIYREEKIAKTLMNIISVAVLNFDYINDEYVDIFIRKSNFMSVLSMVEAVDEEIGYLLKLKEMFLSRENKEDGNG